VGSGFRRIGPPESGKRALAFIAATLVVAAALRVLYLFVRYVLGSGTTARSQVESAAVIFVACGLGLALTRHLRFNLASTDSPALPLWTWAIFCGLAIALYQPALSVGFLSDDFVLVQRAAGWSLGPVSPTLFRPLPLFIWGVLLRAGAGASTLHLLNLILHGTNAYLSARVLERWAPDPRWAVAGGLLVLTAPLNIEAVVWCSGVFDLLATSLILVCVLVAREYDDRPRLATRLQFVLVAVAALASKETAAIAPALVLVDAYVRRAMSRKLLVDVSILIGIVGAFSAWRLASVPGYTTTPFGKYEMQSLVFGSFGSLATPWHVDVVHSRPWLPIAGVLFLVFLLTVFFVGRATEQRRRLVVAAPLWVLLPILPVWATFFVAPDLQQSRYLYLSAIGWAAIIVFAASAGTERRYLKVLQRTAVAGLIAISSFGIRLHLQPWSEAAAVRDQIEAAALAPEIEQCPIVTIGHLPDSVRGAYLFRNGPAEAFARDLHRTAVIDNNAVGECAFRWNDARRSFVR